MKTVFLTVLLALVVASGAFAVTTTHCTVPLYQMTNWIAAPLVPLDPNPLVVFGEWGDIFGGADTVQRMDPTNQSEMIFLNDWGPDVGIVAGDGYRAWVAAAESNPDPIKSFGFDGVDISDTDLWISLPGITGQNGGIHWVGITYPIDDTKYIDYLQVVVTDGTNSYTMDQVLQNVDGSQTWINPYFTFLDGTNQSELSLMIDWGPEMKGGRMYRIQTMKPNLALIIPKPISY